MEQRFQMVEPKNNNAANTAVSLFGYTLKNPVIPASGTFGFGYEFADLYDINCLGSMSLKGTTAEERYGNPLPRIAEAPLGMLNSIGLQNPGVNKVISEEIPKLSKVFDGKVIANVGGHSEKEYVETVAKFNDCDKVFAVELNISCPNVKGGGMAFGTDAKTAENLVKAVKSVALKPIIVKLSPNVTDICELSQAVENGGADGLSLINTLVGMRFDLKTARPVLNVKKGGYSGAGVLPVALRMVYDVAAKTKLPIIGMGGIRSAYDVVEFMYAGATAVMVGTQNLIEPLASKRIVEELPRVMNELKIESLRSIVGKAHTFE